MESEALWRGVELIVVPKAAPGASHAQYACSALENQADKVVRRLNYDIQAPTNRLTISHQTYQVSFVVL